MFKINKPRFSDIRPEVIKVINQAATKLQMYDERFPESEQCGGYHAFKKYCLTKTELVSDQDNLNFNMGNFHVLIRPHVKKAVEVVRNLIKTKNYTVWDKENMPS